ncbi:riboflavin transporter MCH5 [Phlyctema vagabunda]|uniref:Riboflavin transporter MCH5 n=1 Tax=Phlyctema vagabunda TaxID=108571 RepID=A0ABR4PWT8_9HELO
MASQFDQDAARAEKIQESQNGQSSIDIKDTFPAVEKVGETTFPEGGARAWAVAAGTAGILFTTFGYVNAFGVYQEYYSTHQLQDHTPSDISWIGSLQAFSLFGGALFGGPLFDRYGAKVIWPAAVSYVFSIFMTSICKEYYQFMLAQGILGGISTGMVMAPAVACTSQYFHKNRGAAMGMAIGGSSVGGVVFPIALSKMLYNPNLSFGWIVRIIGFLILTVLGISCIPIRARLPPRKGTFFIAAAFRNYQFLSIVGSTFLAMLGVFIPIFYLPSYAVSYGMDPLLASYLVAILNGASFFGRVIPGILADRVGRLNGLFVACISTGILILCWQAVRSNAAIIVFAAIYGFCSGAIVSLMSVALTQVPTDPREIGTYMGMGMCITAFAVLIGPPINGALVARYGGFEQVSIFSGVVVIVGGLSVLFAKHASGKGVFGKV